VTTRLHVADNGEITLETWPGSETGSCQRCHVAARVYGPRGHPLCTEWQQASPKATAPQARLIVPVPAQQPRNQTPNLNSRFSERTPMQNDNGKCPDWCEKETEHDPDGFAQFHWGMRTRINLGGPGDPSCVRVDAYMETFNGKDSPPTVSFGASLPGQEDMSFADLAAKDARTLASVIQVLADANPEQRTEYVAGIRAAADAIEPEAEAG
jgi:hypothetical protein